MNKEQLIWSSKNTDIIATANSRPTVGFFVLHEPFYTQILASSLEGMY